ncbi:MAG: hypothetical protein ACREPF_07340 [Rhodanobacteraceae bacterium]
MHRLRHRLRERVREEPAETTFDRAQMAEELRALRGSLQAPR